MADVKLGWDDDTTPPVVTVGTPSLSDDFAELSLPFSTSEHTIYRVEFGIGNYARTVTGSTTDWSLNHTPVLTGLTAGATYQYRIVALDHRTDPAATPNQGVATGTFLAAAGLNRLGLSEHIRALIPTDVLLPAVARAGFSILKLERWARYEGAILGVALIALGLLVVTHQH